MLFSGVAPISFHLKVVTTELCNPFIEQSNRIKSPHVANEICKVTVAYMYNKDFSCADTARLFDFSTYWAAREYMTRRIHAGSFGMPRIETFADSVNRRQSAAIYCEWLMAG